MTSGNYQKIIELTKAVGADYKALKEEINNIKKGGTQSGYGLDEINELISEAETRVLNKIKGGELAEDLDTLFEIASKIGELISDKNIRDALTATLQEIKTNVTTLQEWQSNFDNLDLVGKYNKAKLA
jgi:hypothetical protein